MDLQRMATQLLQQKLGSNVDATQAKNALEGIFGGGKNLDIGSLVGKFTAGNQDLAAKAKSWLGDGANEAISADQVGQALGAERINDFASKLGIDQQAASSSLSQFLPEIIDKCSRGGNLVENLGGAGGLKGMLSKFLK